MAATQTEIDQAKALFKSGNLIAFFETLDYSHTEHGEEWVDGIVDDGLHDPVPGKVSQPVDVTVDRFTSLEKERLLSEAVKEFSLTEKEGLLSVQKNQLEILRGFADRGFKLNVDQIEKLKNGTAYKIPENTKIINELAKPVLEQAINNTLFSDRLNGDQKIHHIEQQIKNSGSPHSIERIKAILPLIDSYMKIRTTAEEERNPYKREEFLESGKLLNQFNSDTRKDIIEYVAGRMTPEKFSEKVKTRADDTISKLEKHSSSWEAFKDYLLTFEAVAPIIKPLFEDTMKEKVTGMKSSLAGIISENTTKTEEIQNTDNSINTGPKK